MSGRLGRGWLHFPDGTHDAWFDYATGIVGINSPHSSGSEHEQNGDHAFIGTPQVAIFHECAHVVQAATFPWFLRFCELWREHVVDVYAEQWSNGLRWRNLDDLVSRLTKKCVNDGDKLLSMLDVTGEVGFSVLDILESHAVYGHLSRLGQHTTESFGVFVHHSGVRQRYMFAYHWTRAHLGDEQALAGFGALVAAAFCFTRPVAVFEELVKFLTLFGVERGARLDIPALVEAARARGFENEFLGLPSDETKSFARKDDLPSAAQSQLVLALAAKRANTVEELLATQEGLAYAVAAIRPTILYQPDETNLSGVELGPTLPLYQDLGRGREDLPYGIEFAAYKVERFIMGMSQTLIANHASSNPVEVHPYFGWLAGLSWRPTLAAFPGNGESDDPDEIAYLADSLCAALPLNSLGDNSDEAKRTFRELGRVHLAFEINTSLEAWQYPWVRSVIRAIEQRCPAFPLLLTADQTILWFASLSDLAAVSSAGFDPSHRSARLAFYRFLDAVEQLQERAQSDFSPLVQRNLGIWFGEGLGVASPWRGRRETMF